MTVNRSPNKISLAKKSFAQESSFFTENVCAFCLFVGSLAVFLLFWELGARAGIFAKGMPTASKTIQELWW